MTEPTPAELTAERLGGDLHLDPVFQPDTYPGRKEGPGRAVVLYAAGIQLGYLWSNDEDGLGFVAVSDAGIQRTPEFAQAFNKAKAAGTPASEVFDYYAGLASQGLSAGEVRHTDALDTLPE